ncbi:MAG: aminotransferase class V-fold PLP-dependent enzyme [Planctomycetaceae bacterium]|nr:aminotransferase class V-fold PLP-dependent enzyme [Planctomycetaceae bacterium]
MLDTSLWPVSDDSIRNVFLQMLHDGSWGRYHGPHCDQFRREFAEYLLADNVQLCSSGTSAIELCLRAVGVEPGTEVIMAAYDYKANFMNVLALGATPVLIDTQFNSPGIDCSQIEQALSERTRAVICSHLHGTFADIDKAVDLARFHGFAVVEDACQCPGAEINGRRAGTIGDVGAFSFGGSKLLTAGRGGAVVSKNSAIMQRIRLYTQRGNDAYPLSEMQAAVLVPQLHMLDERNRRRMERVGQLASLLASDNAIDVIAALDSATNSVPAFYKVAMTPRHLNDRTEATRSLLDRIEQQALQGPKDSTAEFGPLQLTLSPGFPALHLIHSRKRYRQAAELTNSERWHNQLLTLHHPILLESSVSVESIAKAIQSAVDCVLKRNS